MTQIIGFSGKKQSGKNTACNFIIGHSLISLGVVRNAYQILDSGELQISDLFGDTNHEGIFDVNRPGKAMKDFLKEYVDPWVKLYSFADILKQDVCMKILGLKYEEVYGTDEEKSRETHLRWEDMPGVITDDGVGYLDETPTEETLGREIIRERIKKLGLYYHTAGNMTAREVLQFVGTEIFRKMYSDVWVDALLRRIHEDAPAMALICDVRFPNEVFGLQRSGGLVVRLTRNGDSTDQHPSETSLDEPHFDWNNFNYILDNKNKSIADSNQEIYGILNSLGLVVTQDKPTTKKSKKKEK